MNTRITNAALRYAQDAQQQAVRWGYEVVEQLHGVSTGEVRDFYRPPTGHTGTYLMQMPITDVSMALEILTSPHPTPSIPLVLLPHKGWFDFWTPVPQGVAALKTSFGVCSGECGAGFNWLLPGSRIEFIVNKSSIPFDYPIKLCPTLDNVMVKIDTLIVFQIGKAFEFVTKLGPYKLNDLLAAFLEESIRSLARSVTHDEIYEIRGANLDSMVRSLNDKVGGYGIEISSITITNVLLPVELQQSLQRTTRYNSLQRCKTKEHMYNSMVLENKQMREVSTNKRKNQQSLAKEQSYKYVLLLQKEAGEIESVIQKRLSEINAETSAQVRRVILEGELQQAKLIGEKYQQTQLLKANGVFAAALVTADSEANVIARSSEITLTVSSQIAQAKVIMATAEANSAKQLKDKRKFEISMKQTAILDALAGNKNLVISGSSDYASFAQLTNFVLPSVQ